MKEKGGFRRKWMKKMNGNRWMEKLMVEANVVEEKNGQYIKAWRMYTDRLVRRS